MEHVSVWTATIYLEEHDHQTSARVRLDTKDNHIEGYGVARCHPHDRDVSRIGDELAVARALSDLAHKLFDATVGDIEAMTHEKSAARS
ncbi:MAG TPA: DUF1876 domain-containing protein [Jatrophihabitans sp.]|jgi:hypothetical protein